ncbi:MAG: replication protein C, IncQ-type [Verrucomicrobiota bacterium]
MKDRSQKCESLQKTGLSHEPTYRLTHARHCPTHCLLPGLFRSVPKKKRQKGLELKYQFTGGVRVEVKMFEALGADDMRILQGLIAMAAIQVNGNVMEQLAPAPACPDMIKLRSLLEARGDAKDMPGCTVRCSYFELAKEIGYKNPRDTERIRECIERLYLVTFFIQEGPLRMGFRLLSTVASDSHGIVVALNPKIARAIMGGKHVRILMDEVRALKSDPSRLIHQRICGWIDPGTHGRVGTDKLAAYVWPDTEGVSPTTMRRRLCDIRKICRGFSLPGWRVEEDQGNFTFHRPK